MFGSNSVLYARQFAGMACLLIPLLRDGAESPSLPPGTGGRAPPDFTW